MSRHSSMVITGTSKGIGRKLAEYYLAQGFRVFGCSRGECDLVTPEYHHFTLDVSDEGEVKQMLAAVRRSGVRLGVLINNAGIASMNHALTTPLRTAEAIYTTNVMGTFLFCREAAKLMRQHRFGRIINLASVATPLQLEGEAVYASSKAAVVSLTQILARELAVFGITVNSVGPTPVRTDLIRSVPPHKMECLLRRQAIRRFGTIRDICNVIDFFIRPDSDFVTGQVIYLGGVS